MEQSEQGFEENVASVIALEEGGACLGGVGRVPGKAAGCKANRTSLRLAGCQLSDFCLFRLFVCFQVFPC